MLANLINRKTYTQQWGWENKQQGRERCFYFITVAKGTKTVRANSHFVEILLEFEQNSFLGRTTNASGGVSSVIQLYSWKSKQPLKAFEFF